MGISCGRSWESHTLLLHGGGLPRSIVAQEGGDLALIKIECQAVHGNLHAVSVNLHQVLNGHPQPQMSRFLFHADCDKRKATEMIPQETLT